MEACQNNANEARLLLVCSNTAHFEKNWTKRKFASVFVDFEWFMRFIVE